jgi:arylsulfatase A-like enzyme
MRRYTRRGFLGAGLAAVAGAALGPALASGAGAAGGRRMNVLFLAVDDLKPVLGCYGDPTIQSPHIDRIAARGTVFTRAYCQQAVCSPSRTSLMTGRRPDTTRVYDLQTDFRDTIPDVITLPQQFKANGYHTRGMSKIYHPGFDDALSWSVPHWQPKRSEYASPEAQRVMAESRKKALEAGWDGKSTQGRPRGLPFDAPDAPDNALADGATADHALEALNELKGQPFFLAVGFLKPHLPFVAPKKYWDLYKRSQFHVNENRAAPEGAPAYAPTNSAELRSYYGVPKQGPIPDELALELIHGYYAAASFTDAQIGRVVGELDRLGLRDNTIVILWGDHGWHLGDHGMWCKHTNYEQATHAPLLISAPGQTPAKCDALVEFVDIYPTLCDACGVPTTDGLEGTSFRPLVDNPNRPWKKAAFSQYPRSRKPQGRLMGYAMRTDRYRLVEWRAVKGDFREYELYDYQTDPQEKTNLAAKPENQALVAELQKMLAAGWRGAVPGNIS